MFRCCYLPHHIHWQSIGPYVEVYTLQLGQEMRVVHTIQHSAEDKYLEQLSQTIETMVSQLKEDKHRSSCLFHKAQG